MARNLHKWGPEAYELCDCGQWQTMGHTVDSCPLIHVNGGLSRLHEADGDALRRSQLAENNSTRHMK